MKKTLNNWVIDEMIQRLKDMKGQENRLYACDLGYTLFENENVNGSYYCSTYKALEWIKKYYDDLGEATEAYENNFGEPVKWSPFSDPEAFMVVIILEKSNELIGQCESLNDLWNDETVLSDRLINKIIKDLKGLKD